MASEPTSPGELLQKYGPIVKRVLQRQFASLSADIIDDLVVEAVVRVWKRSKSATGKTISEKSSFPLIFTAARRRAIDHLRYSPRIVFASPEILEQAAAATGSKAEDFPSGLVIDLQAAVTKLEPLDRRILVAAMAPPLHGDWARELALELLQEESNENAGPEIDQRKLSKLRGKLRVRKLRAIEKLRRTMRTKGYDIPNIHGQKR